MPPHRDSVGQRFELLIPWAPIQHLAGPPRLLVAATRMALMRPLSRRRGVRTASEGGFERAVGFERGRV